MRILACLFALGLVTAACSGDDDPSQTTDAPVAPIDAPESTVDAPIDGPNACRGEAYDPCTANDQCMSNNCRLFNMQGIQVCTQTCNATTPCPMQNGQPVQCNNNGLCRPDVANTCTR